MVQTPQLAKEYKKHELPCPSSENNKAYFQCYYSAISDLRTSMQLESSEVMRPGSIDTVEKVASDKGTYSSC